MAFNLFDVGACNCTPVCTCVFSPCPLPTTGLKLDWVSSTGFFSFSNFALTWLSPATLCTWSGNGCLGQSGFVGHPVHLVYDTFFFSIVCSGGTTTVTVVNYRAGICVNPSTTYTWISSGGGSGLTLTSFACSPLSIVFTDTNGSTYTLHL